MCCADTPLQRFFDYNPKVRITAKEALKHPYIRPFYAQESFLGELSTPPAGTAVRGAVVSAASSSSSLASSMLPPNANKGKGAESRVNRITPDPLPEIGAEPVPSSRYDILGEIDEEAALNCTLPTSTAEVAEIVAAATSGAAGSRRSARLRKDSEPARKKQKAEPTVVTEDAPEAVDPQAVPVDAPLPAPTAPGAPAAPATRLTRSTARK